MTLVVGLSAKAQHGKGSTVQLAQIKRQSGDGELEIRQVSFATALKEYARDIVTIMDGYGPESSRGLRAIEYLYEKGLPREIGKQVVMLAHEPHALTLEDLKKKTPQARKLLQFIGTEAFRRNVDNEYWVKVAAEKIRALPPETEVVFIPDTRFVNEADFVRNELKGEVWRLERYATRTGEVFVEPFDNGLSAEAKAHKSEVDLDEYRFDRVIKHDTMDSLFHAIAAELKRLGFA